MATGPVRARVTLPPTIRRGDVIVVRTLIGHPMETGYRADDAGRRVPRDILTRLEARLDGRVVFAAQLHPAVAANPALAFTLRVDGPGTLEVRWEGDNGFSHTERVAIEVA